MGIHTDSPASEPISTAEHQRATLMRVLVIEDNTVDFLLIENAMGEAFSVAWASTLAQGLEMAGRDEFDLIILDLTLDDSLGFQAFEKVRASSPMIPIVVLSDIDDEKLAMRAVSNGAQDHIRKSSLINYPLDRAVRYAIERRRAEEAKHGIERRYRTLIANLSMEHPFGILRHQLLTPLAALRTVGQYLINNGGRNTNESELLLREMSREVDRMSHTVDTLLETARLNSVRTNGNWGEFDLAETVDAAIASISLLVDPKRIRILRHVDRGDGRLWGDADAIHRLLLNLLSNARTHTVRGQIEVLARKYQDWSGAWMEVAVRDSGCGIPAIDVDRLGESFALNSAVVRNGYASRTELGLAICNRIVLAHGGELLIASVPGKGTTVTARLRADLNAAVGGNALSSKPAAKVAA
jgi:signal transduction histidine kinase